MSPVEERYVLIGVPENGVLSIECVSEITPMYIEAPMVVGVHSKYHLPLAGIPNVPVICACFIDPAELVEVKSKFPLAKELEAPMRKGLPVQ